MTAAYDGGQCTIYNHAAGSYQAPTPGYRGEANWSKGKEIYDKHKKYDFALGDSVFPYGRDWYIIPSNCGSYVGRKIASTVFLGNIPTSQGMIDKLKHEENSRFPVALDANGLQQLYHIHYSTFSQSTREQIDRVIEEIAKSNVTKMNRSGAVDCLAFMCVIA